LTKYPNIEKVSRDGSPTYARAISKALPNAIQISDRFHLIQGLSIALKADLIIMLPPIVRINDKADDDYEMLEPTQKEKAEIQRHERSLELAKALRERYRECGQIVTLIEEFGISYRTVRKYLDSDPVRQRHDTISSLTPYFETIYNEIKNGKRTYQIFKIIQNNGYNGTFSNMLKYIRVKKSKGLFSDNCVSRGDLLKLLFNRGPRDLSIGKPWQDKIIRYLNKHKYINSIIMVATEFRIALFSKNAIAIHRWIERAKTFSELKNLQSFVNGTKRDIGAVENAIKHDESNGVVEGVVCKIKKVKRVHYGRCGFHLLRQKILE